MTIRAVIAFETVDFIPNDPIPTTIEASPQPPRDDGTVAGEIWVVSNGDGDCYEWTGAVWENRGTWAGSIYDRRRLTYPTGTPPLNAWMKAVTIPNTNPQEWLWLVKLETGDTPEQWPVIVNFGADPTSEDWHTIPVDPSDANQVGNRVPDLNTGVGMQNATGAECALAMCESWGYDPTFRFGSETVVLFREDTVDRRSTRTGGPRSNNKKA